MLTFTNDMLRDKIKADLGVDVPADRDFLPFSDLEKSVRDDVLTVQQSPLVAPSRSQAGSPPWWPQVVNNNLVIMSRGQAVVLLYIFVSCDANF
jgi:hypothetical protein